MSFAADIKVKKRARSREIGTIFDRNHVERMIFPTMESTTSIRDGGDERSGEKRGTPLKPEVNKDLCRVVFLRDPIFFHGHTAKGRARGPIIVAIGRVRA